MKVVLIRYWDQATRLTRLPHSLNKSQGVLPPQGLAYIARFLKIEGIKSGNIDVDIIDCQAENLDHDQFMLRLCELNPDIVGIGPMMTPALEGVYECAFYCWLCGIKVVVGGPHLDIYPEETVSNYFIDFGIRGEAEYSFLELMKCLESGKDYTHIEGLIYKIDDQVIVNPYPAIVEDLENIPMPAYHLLPMDKYDSIIGVGKASTVMATRGCPFHCSFCCKTPSDMHYRERKPFDIVDEIEWLMRDYGIEYIMFYDDVITLRKKFISELCDEMIENDYDIKWEAPSRIDCLSYPLLAYMKRAGCVRLRMGVESGNEKILESMNKNITKDMVRQVFGWCKKLGIETFAYFIIGYFGETEETIRETIDFAIELDPDYVMFTKAVPLPKTQFWRDCEEAGLVPPNYWRDYTLRKNVGALPDIVKDADKWVARAYHRFYFRKKYIMRNLKRLKSWNYIKKAIRGVMALRGL